MLKKRVPILFLGLLIIAGISIPTQSLSYEPNRNYCNIDYDYSGSLKRAYLSSENRMKCLDYSYIQGQTALLLRNNHDSDIVINQIFEDPLNIARTYDYPIGINCKYFIDRDKDGVGVPIVGARIASGEKFVLLIRDCQFVKSQTQLLMELPLQKENLSRYSNIGRLQEGSLFNRFSMTYFLPDENLKEYNIDAQVGVHKSENVKNQTSAGLTVFTMVLTLILLGIIALIVYSGMVIKPKKVTLANKAKGYK